MPIASVVKCMSMTRTLFRFARMVSLLAVVFAVASLPPTSAHAGMAHDHSPSNHAVHAIDSDSESEQNHHLSDGAHSDGVTVETASDHGDSGQCCSSICVSSAMLETSTSSDGAMRENHVEKLVLKLASANILGFLRPPNL